MRPFLSPSILRVGYLIVSLFCPTELQATEGEDTRQIRFNRDIRPILSDRCFLCHGPDQTSEISQETDLRLDHRDLAVDYGVFDFEQIDASEILARITTDDPDVQMPPPDSKKKLLTDSEVSLLREWIEQGAKYEQHWAYISAQRPTVPTVDAPSPVSHPIDAFVLRKLKAENLTPSPPADRPTLIRRVTFDLTGLPPTIEEIEAFLKDTASESKAYEAVVDRLLASQQYGEHMARLWLDAARYADTSGYQYDFEREQWVWRDWVIHAFNTNKPFDEFTIEQVAGDLLPNATEQTRLATGFHRNHPITVEGGVVDEEYRTEYVVDRVVTTSTVWLGQTFLCARCHDHKYDPISQKDFYQFFAFFNNVPEKGLNGFNPKLKVPSPLAQDQIAFANQALEAMEKQIADRGLPLDEWERRLRSETPDWHAPVPASTESTGGAVLTPQEDQSILVSGENPAKDDYVLEFSPIDQDVLTIQLEALLDPSLPHQSASRSSNGNFVLSEFVMEAALEDSPEDYQPVQIDQVVADYSQDGFPAAQAIDGKLGRRGWAVSGNVKRENRTATFHLKEPIPAGAKLRIVLQQRYGSSHQIGRFRISFSDSPAQDPEVQQWLNAESDKPHSETRPRLTHFLLQRYGDSSVQSLVDDYTSALARLDTATTFPETMVLEEMSEPRQAYVLERGEYDKPRKDEPVQPTVPTALGSLPPEAPGNRLGLALWLVSREQPLTARVTVNRFWQQLFGTGLVKTSEDFGSQGEYPSHPQLLDWLAVEFMETGWDVKKLMKTIVMSNTYRQAARLTEDDVARDPENRLLARGPRVRVDGEVIRDSALAVSGLLNLTLGGPSVYPYHPQGLWLEINNRPNFSRAYPHQTNPSQHHRRSMYTFWKRTVPPPSVATFDAPSREYCIVRRSRTNTPLQAFVMLHDPQFVEAARHLAARMIREGGPAPTARIAYGFQLCTSRRPNEQELAILADAYEERLTQYQNDMEAAERVLSVGLVPVTSRAGQKPIEPAELAAMTQVARMLMNLSEFLTKS